MVALTVLLVALVAFIMVGSHVFIAIRRRLKDKQYPKKIIVTDITAFASVSVALVATFGLSSTLSSYVMHRQYSSNVGLILGERLGAFGMLLPWLELPAVLLLFLVLGIRIITHDNPDLRQTKTAADVALLLTSGAALFISASLAIQKVIYVNNAQITGNLHTVTGGVVWTGLMWLELPALFCLMVILGKSAFSPALRRG